MSGIKLWLLGIGASLTAGAAFAWANKKLPDMMAGWVDAQIVKALSSGDDIDDELVLALCRWAEKKIALEFPCGGMGKMKYQLVAQKLISFLPLSVRVFASKNSDKIASLIEANVERLQKELADVSNKYPATPNAPQP